MHIPYLNLKKRINQYNVISKEGNSLFFPKIGKTFSIITMLNLPWHYFQRAYDPWTYFSNTVYFQLY